MWFQQTNGGSLDHPKLSGHPQEFTSAMAGYQNSQSDWTLTGEMTGMGMNGAASNGTQMSMYGGDSSDNSAFLAHREANRRQALVEGMDAGLYGSPAPSHVSGVSNSTQYSNYSNFNSMALSPTAMQILMQQQFGSNPLFFPQDQQVSAGLPQQPNQAQVSADNTQPLSVIPDQGSLGPKLEVPKSPKNIKAFNDSFETGIPGGLNPESLVKRSFPEKIYAMLEAVEAQGNDHVISHVADGSAFMIHNPTIFETDVMPLYFSSRRMASFQRQLNIYGFKRVEKGPFRGAYSHEYFLKGKKQLLEKIKRSNKKLG